MGEIVPFKGLLQTGGGGGTSDGMEARVAKLEAHVEHVLTEVGELRKDVRDLRNDLKTDFRWLAGGYIVMACALLGVMAKGFHWL